MNGRVAAGVRWAFLSGVVARLAPPLFTIVLARILAPEQFGLLAIAMVVVAFVALFQDAGLKPALVQHKDYDADVAGAVFWGSIGFGVLWFAVIYMAAPWIGGVYRNPSVVPVLRALACLFPINALAVVPEGMLLREVDFRRLFRVELFPSLVPGIVAIGLGLAGYGVWALVLGAIAGAALRAIALWTLAPWLPRALPAAAAWGRVFRFGGWVSAEGVLAWLITYADQAFAGRFLGVASVGYYQMGFAIALLPARGVALALGRVLFPAFSRVQEDTRAVRQGFEVCVRMVALVTIPMGIAILFFADPLVPLLLGRRWETTARVVQVLAVTGILSSLVNIAPPLYRAVGRVDIMPKFFTGRAAVSVPVYWYFAQQGLMALAAAHLALTLCFAPVNFAIAMRVFGSRAAEVGPALGIPLMLSLVAVGASRLAEAGVPDRWEAVGIAVGMLVFVAAYGLLLRTFARRRYDEFMGVLRRTLTPSGT